jgi:hypothetical protein
MSEATLYSIILLFFSITFPVGYIVWRWFTLVFNKRDKVIKRRVRNRMPFPSFMPPPPPPKRLIPMPRVQAPRQDPITVNNAQKVLILEALAKVNVENEKEEVVNTPPPTVRLIREN